MRVIIHENSSPFNNFVISGSDQFHLVGGMGLDISNSNNSTIFLNITDLQDNIIDSFNQSQVVKNQFQIDSPSLNLTKYFNLNSSYQGTYKVKLYWANNNLTKIGYYEQNVYFVISTTLTIYPPRAEYYVGEQVFLNGTFSDFFNDTIYSNASVSYVTDWGLSGSFSFNNSNNLFETNISTLDASNGDHVIIITATGPYFANQSIEFTIDVDIMRPSSLNLISKNGFQFSNNNTAQLSSNLQLSYLYSNLLNSTPITSSNLTLFLNGNPINLTTNNKGITVCLFIFNLS